MSLPSLTGSKTLDKLKTLTDEEDTEPLAASLPTTGKEATLNLSASKLTLLELAYKL